MSSKTLVSLLTLLQAVPSLQSDLKILSTPDGKTRPLPCALTCSGVSRHDEPRDSPYKPWSLNFHSQAEKHIDIAECGFSSTPVVTVSMRGPYVGSLKCPAVYVQYVFDKIFTVLTVESVTESQMTGSECDVYWTANGYNC